MRPRKSSYAIQQSPLYALVSRSRLASLLKVSNGDLRRLSLGSDLLYREFGIPKPQGGVRDIEDPARHLKALQSRLALLLSRISPNENLFCPVKGRSYVGNAAHHCGRQHIYCLDIKNFYPSVTSRRVFYFFNTIMCCEKDVAALLTSISTYKGHIPTGSPLSPILAYFCYTEMWERIADLCNRRGYKLSIYVDDITISSGRIGIKDVWTVKQIIASYGLDYHKEREFRSRPAIVTGCVVNDQELQVPHAQHRKRRLLVAASKLVTNEPERMSIAARIAGLETQMRQIKVFASRV